MRRARRSTSALPHSGQVPTAGSGSFGSRWMYRQRGYPLQPKKEPNRPVFSISGFPHSGHAGPPAAARSAAACASMALALAAAFRAVIGTVCAWSTVWLKGP